MFKIKSYFVVASALWVLSCTHDPVSLADVGPADTTGTNPIDTTDTNTVECSPDTVYFRQTILPLLVNSCGKIGCHSPETASDEVVIADYQSIMQTADVRPGDPDNSELYEVLVEDDEDKRMPRAPEPGMSAENIALVRKWIQQGAKDNSCEASACEIPASVTYDAVIRPIFQGKCFGCHNSATATGGIILDTYEGALQASTSGRLAGAVEKRSGYTPMPPGGTLPACDLKKIQEWIKQGNKP